MTSAPAVEVSKALARVRAACSALPEVVERPSHGAPSFFVPPYVGGRGWLGVRLDRDPDWDEIGSVCIDAYRCVAPKKLSALLGTT